jgi:hypothetical protein
VKRLYEVYVPTVIAQKVEGDIYIYSRFFAIRTVEDLQKFADELSDSALARNLALCYKEVFTMGRFRRLTKADEDAFWDKSLDEVYTEGRFDEKRESAKKALNMGLSIEQAAEISGLDIQKIKNELLIHA